MRVIVGYWTGIRKENQAPSKLPIDRRSLEQYDLGHIPGPRLIVGNTPLDLLGSPKSNWNRDTITLLALQVRMKAYNTSRSGRDDTIESYQEIVRSRVARFCTKVHHYTPQLIEGTVETKVEAEQRFSKEKEQELIRSRLQSRRNKVSSPSAVRIITTDRSEPTQNPFRNWTTGSNGLT